MYTKKCATCGKEFKTYKGNQVNCSVKCKDSHYLNPDNSMERFLSKVNKTNTCWLWTDSLTHDGYGRFWFARKTVLAHRFAYENLVGPIPENLTCDHLCKNRVCVNPAHIELVTALENTRRGKNATKTHCMHGHEFTPENTAYNARTNKRACRICMRESSRSFAERAKEKIKKLLNI